MIAVGTCCTRASSRSDEPASAGPATRLPATASRNVGATAPTRSRRRRPRRHGQAIDQQRAGVVQQALAFENRQDALRRLQRPQHRGGRRGIGRRDDGAERDRRRPRQLGHEHARDDGDGGRREAHRDDDEAGDRRPVVAEVARRGVVGRVEQDRRDEQRQRQLGSDGERAARPARTRGSRRRGRERPDRAPDSTRGGGEQDGRDEEDEDLFEVGHVGRPPALHTRRSGNTLPRVGRRQPRFEVARQPRRLAYPVDRDTDLDSAVCSISRFLMRSRRNARISRAVACRVRLSIPARLYAPRTGPSRPRILAGRSGREGSGTSRRGTLARRLRFETDRQGRSVR